LTGEESLWRKQTERPIRSKASGTMLSPGSLNQQKRRGGERTAKEKKRGIYAGLSDAGRGKKKGDRSRSGSARMEEAPFFVASRSKQKGNGQRRQRRGPGIIDVIF